MDHYALKPVKLFAKTSDDSLKKIVAQMQVKRFVANEIVFNQHDPAPNVYFILNGRVRITIYSTRGQEISFVEMGTGECFGEIAAIDRANRSAGVACVTETTLAFIGADTFRRWLRDHDDVAEGVLLHLCGIVRRLSERVFEFSTMVVRSRLHAELLRMAEHSGPAHDGAPVSIDQAPTHLELANRIGTQRETVTRELSDLAKEGIIERGRGRLVIKNVAALRDLVEAALHHPT